MKRKLPPYGHEVIAALNDPDTWPKYIGTSADGTNVQLWVAIGTDAWDWANERRACKYLVVAMPPDADPEAFNWEFLADHDPVMLCAAGYADEKPVDACVRALMRDGVQRVMYLASDTPAKRYVAEGVTHAA